MTFTIETRRDRKRGCGWRQPGGLYMVSSGLGEDCGKLPIECETCKTCGHGIKPSRSFAWIDLDQFTGQKACTRRDCPPLCPLSRPLGTKAGLIWIGGAFYKTPQEFTAEANRQGVSRRIPAVPKDFKLGQTWVAVAHREAYHRLCDCAKPDKKPEPKCEICKGNGRMPVQAIFHLFRPTAIEYVVKGDENEKQLSEKAKRGITLVRVERVGETGELALAM
jgi:hypothetical protein